MKTLSCFIFPLLLLYTATAYCQEKLVYLVEDVQKKHTVIYVQNDTNLDKSVFLKIDPIGYRRRAQRPVLKNIPANSKVQMSILIPLTDKESSYTYNLIVNDQLENINTRRQKEKPKEIKSQTIANYKLFIYTDQDCNRCDTLIQKLKENKIRFLEVDIDSKNNLLSPLFWRKMLKEGYTRENIELPFAKKNKKLYYPIPNFDILIEEITKKPERKKRISLF
ncbi:hypothetical protein SAMN04487910_3353 [Aquimarina amphilecti]|uniref:Glutaredoxin n=1 Tax=Aquimarina amphilecti TaxID=1038014 RepID=A0A1H7TB28_AQUAM|nr:hypothetical protein [Aquimarina amphilecti]SEL81933.1 hypothetical protein SAMN04487910_3353 [Aquimarina amphilecti]